MIALSRFRPAARVAVALLVTSCLSLASCGNRVCNLIGCYSGLTIQFHGGTFADGGAPADTFDINIETQENQNFLPLMTCYFTTAAGELRCNSPWSHREDSEGTHIDDTSLKAIRVTVSAAGHQISQETFALTWTSQEVGCGTCTQATAMVTLPSE